MSNKGMVSLDDAIEQVRKTASRLALLHLGFSNTLVKEFGEEKAKELIIKSIAEYGKLVANYQKQDNLPYYGLYEIQTYKDQNLIDIRNISLSENEDFEFEHYRVYGCIIAKTFLDLKAEEFGRLYCYVDAAKSMAENPEKKFIHKECVLCGDDYCTFKYESTSEKEKDDFINNNSEWKTVDPILLKE